MAAPPVDWQSLVQEFSALVDKSRPLGSKPTSLGAGASSAVAPPKAVQAQATKAKAKKASSQATAPASPKKVEFRRRILMLVYVLVVSTFVPPLISMVAPGQGYVVASGSMEPTIPEGSLAVAREAQPKLGDVIVYASPVGGNTIHRIVGESQSDGRHFWQTAGDANPAGDAYAVPDDAVLGVVTSHTPYVGYLWLLPGGVQPVIFAVLLIGYLSLTGWDARVLWWRRRRAVAIGTAIAVLALVLAFLVPSTLGSIVSNAWPATTLTGAVATTPIPHAAGTMGSASISGDSNSATATAPSPKLWREVVIWGCDPAAGCSHTPPGGNTYVTIAGSIFRIDTAQYTPAAHAYLEAYMRSPNGANSVFTRVIVKGGAAIAASEVSTSSTGLTLVRGNEFALNSGAIEYQIQTKTNQAGAGGEIRMVKLILWQQYPTKTSTQVRLSSAGTTASTTMALPARGGQWMYTQGDGVTSAFLEAVGFMNTGSLNAGEVELWDITAAPDAAVAGSKITFGILTNTATRQRHAASIHANLVNGNEYEVRYRVTGAASTLNLNLARIVIAQSDGGGLTSTLDYVDLSWQTTTTSTAYTTAGYQGRYAMDSALDGTIYFEATLSDTGGNTASARLVHTTDGAVTGGEVTTTSTTPVRVRSSALTLSSANSTYAVEFKTGPAGTTNMRLAWIFILVSTGKTYDHVLKTRNDVAGNCAWTFKLEHTGDSNLARISSATIKIRGNAVLQNQIVVSAGAVTQTSGTAVTVDFNTNLEHVVVTNPTSAGTSTINANLKGDCGGSHSIQPLTFSLT